MHNRDISCRAPLHIAAMLGHLDFCYELVSRNPRLTREVDYRRSTALHIASARGYIATVIVLVDASPEMCMPYDGDGLNPIRIAAMKGRVNVLEKLVNVNSDGVAARVRICQGGTTLHLCVQYHQIEALKFLVEFQNNKELLNAKDDNGNSILHLSVGDKQVEIVEYLVSRPSMDVEAKNSNGLTASNILALLPKRDSKYMEIAHFLQLTTILGLQQMQILPQNQTNGATKNLDESFSKSGKYEDVWLEKQQNSIMVVASVIATMAFQAGINPPAAIVKGEGDAGIYANHYMASNTIAFFSSLSVILLLISGFPLMHKALMWTWMAMMWISITTTAYTYFMSISATSEWSFSPGFTYPIFAWFDLMMLFLIVHIMRLLCHPMKGWPSKNRVIMWTLMISLSWIAAPFIPYGLRPDWVFSNLVKVLTVLTIFGIGLYAFQLACFIIRKSESGFQIYKFVFR